MLAVKEFRSNMNITRIDKKDGNYTRISNDLINDSRLSLKEKGIMLHILSKPDNWILNIKEIANNNQDGEKAVYSGIKKLKEYGYIVLKPVYNEFKKITSWIYYINESPSINIVNTESELLTQNLQVGKLQVGIRQYNNTNNNNTNNNNDDKEKNHHEISEIENVENSVIEFADKSDSKKANELFDEVIYNSDVFNFSIQDSRIKNIKLDNIPKAIKKNNLALVLETIKMFPEYAKKTNQGLNPKGKFTENEMLTYLKTILNNDCQYPKWFNDLYKQESVKQAVKIVEDNWKPITSIWKAYGNRIDDSIKIMIETILNFISESEKYKKENKPDSNYLKITRQTFKESTQKTLKIKSIDEMIHLINEYSNKEWNNADKFKEVISNYFDNNSLDTIKAYFKVVI